MDLHKLLRRSKYLTRQTIPGSISFSSSANFYFTGRFTFNTEQHKKTSNSNSNRSVGIFWDLDNKPPTSVPPYDAAIRLKYLATRFGLPNTMVAYANRHAFTFLPDWVRAQRRQRKALDIMESNGIIRSRDPYDCEVCGRKFETNIKFQKHFRQLHEREHHKRLARLECLKGKNKDFFKAKIGPKEDKYRAAASKVLSPKEGYGLAGELKRAGFLVRTVRDKPQAADVALENDMMEAIENGIQCLCLVSDDSDFVRVLKKAKARKVRTVVVGDMYGDLKIFADANFAWRDVAEGHAWKDYGGQKQVEWSYRSRNSEKSEEEQEEEGNEADFFESIGPEDDVDDFRLEECNDEGFNFKVKQCKDEDSDLRVDECKYEAFEASDKILFASKGRRSSYNQRKARPWWKLVSD